VCDDRTKRTNLWEKTPPKGTWRRGTPNERILKPMESIVTMTKKGMNNSENLLAKGRT